MKLIDLLETGKKATVPESEGEWYLEYKINEDNMGTLHGVKLWKNETTTIVNINDLGVDLLFSNKWVEYTDEEDYKTNFKTNGNPYFFIASDGEIVDVFRKNIFEEEKLENFNVFLSKELAEYIQAKQLLERKLMIFSYLNGADKINWNEDNEFKYYIDYYYDYYENENENEIEIISIFGLRENNRVYFKTKEIAEKALELYREEIKRVMKMGLKFGF